MADIQDAINKIIEMREKEHDPVAFRKKLGISLYTALDERTGESIKIRDYDFNIA